MSVKKSVMDQKVAFLLKIFADNNYTRYTLYKFLIEKINSNMDIDSALQNAVTRKLLEIKSRIYQIYENSPNRHQARHVNQYAITEAGIEWLIKYETENGKVEIQTSTSKPAEEPVKKEEAIKPIDKASFDELFKRLTSKYRSSVVVHALVHVLYYQEVFLLKGIRTWKDADGKCWISANKIVAPLLKLLDSYGTTVLQETLSLKEYCYRTRFDLVCGETIYEIDIPDARIFDTGLISDLKSFVVDRSAGYDSPTGQSEILMKSIIFKRCKGNLEAVNERSETRKVQSNKVESNPNPESKDVTRGNFHGLDVTGVAELNASLELLVVKLLMTVFSRDTYRFSRKGYIPLHEMVCLLCEDRTISSIYKTREVIAKLFEMFDTVLDAQVIDHPSYKYGVTGIRVSKNFEDAYSANSLCATFTRIVYQNLDTNPFYELYADIEKLLKGHELYEIEDLITQHEASMVTRTNRSFEEIYGNKSSFGNFTRRDTEERKAEDYEKRLGRLEVLVSDLASELRYRR